MKISLASHKIVTIALYNIGGGTHYVDLEDIAIKANEIAPGRFTWRKHKDQINIKNIEAFLWDASKFKNGAFVVGNARNGWMLTEEGVKFAAQYVTSVKDSSQSNSKSIGDHQGSVHGRSRLLTADAFIKYCGENKDDISRQEAEAFFRIDEYIKGKSRDEKIRRVLNMYTEDPELGDAVRFLANIVMSKENQE